MLKTAELFQRREEEMLSPYAFPSAKTKGRLSPSEPCPYRTEFQRDRDRIIHCKSFRRLMHKTQVFFAPLDEQFRTRMTHTLEVTQIARSIARALRLNEDLTEAIAMGHDLGHTPFGHEGEAAMRKCYDPSFSHYRQSLRVVDFLEHDGKGLNLTFEVRDGILNHPGDHMACTLEGVVVKFSDRIAYVNHDLDDAFFAGILSPDDLPHHLKELFTVSYSNRVDTMVSSVIEASMDKNEIKMTPDVGEAMMEMRAFLTEHIYHNSPAKREEKKAEELLCRLFEYFTGHPEEMPPFYYRNIEKEGTERMVCDFIAGMTDRYAIDLYSDLFIPEVWKGTPSFEPKGTIHD
ncbi:MAG: deoxyguanosinetriphosphate triphosphohydrolase [Clostridia bacterium]|nr:deoxyguanosinetriphosphate triphosphohydrolase [Clostridia bacterium]